MSSSGVDVQEKKDPTEVVHWNEYEALRDHFKLQLDRSCDSIAEDVQNVQLKLDTNEQAVNAIQTQVIEMQRSLDTIQQAMTDLRAAIDLRPQQHAAQDDDASVHGDNDGDIVVDAALAHEQQDYLGRRANDLVVLGHGGG